MSRSKKTFNCPAELCVSLIGGKWKVILLYNLRARPRRFGELKRLSPGITSTMLAKELKELQETKLVRRTLLGRDRLAGTEYALTAHGESLRPVLNAMIRWGLAHQNEFVLGNFGMAAFMG